MRRKLPPFPALRAFEAAARLGSFRAAGDELCVTASAISHQIRNLEEYVGEPLFIRTPLGPNLNANGRSYQQKLTTLLDQLESETLNLFPAETPDTISVKGTPGFLARWLIPRLSGLKTATGLDVRLTSGLPPTDFSSGEFQIIIHWGDQPVSGAVVEPFLSTPKIAVAAPEYLRQVGSIKTVDTLADCCLLRDEVGDLWHEWLKIAGASEHVTPDGPILAHCELVLTAAEKAQGIALAYAALVQQELMSGQLQQVLPYQTDDKLIYSVSYPNDQRRNPQVRAFRDWVFSEVTHDLKNGRSAVAAE
jgi:LysR family transcriptional regulator, glycine cleavage system transcriptional activator